MRELTLKFVKGKDGFASRDPKARSVLYAVPLETNINFHYYYKARQISTVAEMVAVHIWKYTGGGQPCRYVDIPYKSFEGYHIASAECKKALKALLAEGLITEIWRDRDHMSVFVADEYQSK